MYPTPLTGILKGAMLNNKTQNPIQWELLVPRVNTSTMQRRAFSVIAPSIWNSLPSQIRLLPKSYTPLLYKLLKTDLLHRGWTGSASE